MVLKLLAVNHFLYYQKLNGIVSIALFNKYAIEGLSDVAVICS